MKEIKNICIYGVGGVGGYFAAQILKNNSDKSLKVSFIARGEHLKEIEKNGLTLKTKNEVIKVYPDYIARMDEFNDENIDLLILCVKSYDLEEAVSCIKDKLSSETIILPLLNGINISERIKKIANDSIVLPACVYIGTHIEKPGVISQNGGDGKIIFGNDFDKSDIYAEAVKSIFNKSQINYSYIENPYKEIWTKYMFIAACGLVTAYTGKTLGQVAENEELHKDVEAIMEEIKLIADKKGVFLDEDVIKKSLAKIKTFPYEAKTSFQRDVEIKGKKNEADLFGGTIIKMGEEFGISTTTTKKYYIIS